MGGEAQRLDAEVVHRLKRLTWSLALGHVWLTAVVITGIVLLLRH